MKIKINKHIAIFIIGIGVFLLFAILAYMNVFQIFQLKLSDRLYLELEKTSEKNIVIVQIDEKSLDHETGLGHFSLWNRGFFAQTLKNINKYKPKLVAFDIFFKSPKDPQTDQEFADALKETNAPVLIHRNNPKIFSDGYFLNDEEVVLPLPLLTQNNKNTNLAMSNVLPDPDNVVRRIIPRIFNKRSSRSPASVESRYGGGETNAPLSLKKHNLIENNPYSSEASDSFAFVINKIVSGDESAAVKGRILLEQGQMLINYFSSPEKPLSVFQKFSFVDVYNENYFGVDPEKIFKNKIVLIGAAAPYFNDSYMTPASSKVLMSGIEIHANAISTILEEKFLRNETLLEKVIGLFVICLLSAFVFMRSKIRWSSLFLIVVPVTYTLAAPIAFKQGLILDLIHPYFSIVTVFIESYIYRYMTEFKEKLALKNAFTHYVSPKVADEIMAHPENLRLGGEKREITVLFTDIVHFTSIAEKLKPESLSSLLNEYFEAMSQVIFEEGGTLDKFEGDAIMAFFGAPVPQKDHAARACLVALKMRLRLTTLINSWKTNMTLPGGEKKPAIDFRCGINTGEVIVGNMGSIRRFNYTAMGDAVNLASRLEGANKKYNTRVMIGETTYKAVYASFETRELDTIQVVGKEKPVKVYELLAPKDDLPPDALRLLKDYSEGIQLYHERKFAIALNKFEQILTTYPDDGPSKLYRQRCEVLRDFPPPADWDGVFEMETK